MLSYEEIKIAFYIILGIALLVFFFKNDEFPLLVSIFLYTAGISRYEQTVIVDGGKFVRVAYARSIFSLNSELALEALNWFLWGSFVLVLTYAILLNFKKQPRLKPEDNQLLAKFNESKSKSILIFFIFFLVVNSVVSSLTLALFKSGAAVSYGISYLYYFSMAVGGFLLLLLMTFRSLKFKRQGFLKFVLVGLMAYAAYMSYNPNVRFILISWVVAAGIILYGKRKAVSKSVIYVLAGTGLVLFLAVVGTFKAGTSTGTRDDLTLLDRLDFGLERLNKNEDSNMLDGFMMVMQVYPDYLDFSKGIEHFEILLRPIPRSIWPDKPVGGYHNKLGLNENQGGGAIGISPSLYGTFYAEGGGVGVIFISFLYAFFYLYIFNLANRYRSDVRYLIKGMILASTIALLRGGDLPGIFAFIGMSYWPVFIYIRQYNKFVRKNHQALMAYRREQDQQRLMQEAEAEAALV